LHPSLLYSVINTQLYNYRVDNNSDSVTGEIKTKNKTVRKPQEVNEENVIEYVIEFDKYLSTELDIYKHDTFLRTLVGMNFEDILLHEFKSDCSILHLVDQKPMEELKNFHNYLRDICNQLYDIKI
jgi:hypothetical protein